MWGGGGGCTVIPLGPWTNMYLPQGPTKALGQEHLLISSHNLSVLGLGFVSNLFYYVFFIYRPENKYGILVVIV